jgi:hypothetical protein
MISSLIAGSPLRPRARPVDCNATNRACGGGFGLGLLPPAQTYPGRRYWPHVLGRLFQTLLFLSFALTGMIVGCLGGGDTVSSGHSLYRFQIFCFSFLCFLLLTHRHRAQGWASLPGLSPTKPTTLSGGSWHDGGGGHGTMDIYRMEPAAPYRRRHQMPFTSSE